LCRFLDKEIPDIPFPHKNVDGKGIAPEMNNHPLGKQMQKEFIIFAVIFAFLAVGVCIFFGM